MNFDNEFKGKKVVVTGAGGIIGGWIAEAFAKEGALVCLTDLSLERIESRKASLPGEGHLALAADLTDSASLSALADQVAKAWGAPDILINNAGIYPSGFLLDISVDDWDAIFDINLRAPFILSQLFAKQMIAAGKGGSIVNISSGAARKMRTTVVPYCTSKTALDRLTKGFALELAEYGIRVNAVEPGFAAGSDVSTLTTDHVTNVTASIPLGRASSAADVGAAVLYVSSGAAAYMTGATITVDGGNSIGSQVIFQAKKKAL